MDKTQAILGLCPGALFCVRGDVVEWMDDIRVQPTDDEIAAYIETHSYAAKRAKEYPAVTDQLDAIMKGGQTLADMQAACMAVKAKYPKGA